MKIEVIDHGDLIGKVKESLENNVKFVCVIPSTTDSEFHFANALRIEGLLGKLYTRDIDYYTKMQFFDRNFPKKQKLYKDHVIFLDALIFESDAKDVFTYLELVEKEGD